MGGQLLETQGDTLLLLIEVKDDDLDLLIEGDNLFRMVDTAPGEIGDMDETVNTAEVDEYAVVGDVLDGSFENLTLLKLGDEFGPLLLLLGLEQSLVGYDDIAELLVDLDDLEVHGRIDIYIVVADRLDIDLGSREERLDAEDIDNHAALGTGLDEALDDIAGLVGRIDHVPGLEGAGLPVGEDELTLAVFGGLDEDFHLVTDLQVRVVTEFRSGDDAFALGADVHDDLSLVDRGDGSLDDLVLDDAGEGLVIEFFVFLPVFSDDTVILESIPIEVFGIYRCVESGFFNFFCHNLF